MSQRIAPAAPATGLSLALPAVLAVTAPLAVIFTILILHNVWWTFALYQVGICLLIPALESWRRGRNWRGHAELLGLVEPSGSTWPAPWKTFAVGLGIATLLVTGGFLVLTRDRFLDPGRMEEAVTGWGVTPDQMVTMLAVMAVLNAAAEELFWRGYLPGRIAEARPDSHPPAGLTVILPAVLYASYHAVTIHSLVGEPLGVALMTGGVLGAGLIWGWFRRRTGSVWPALLSHGGAVTGYLAVQYWIVGTGGG